MEWQIYENLIKLREKNNLTIEELSDKSGISKLTISNIENRITYSHNIDIIAKLALALGVTVDEFVCEKL